MYGLNPASDLGFLNGVTLTQASFGENELILHFDSGCFIRVEGGFRVGASQLVEHSQPAAGAAEVTGLLGHVVARYEVLDSSHLLLQFESGARFVALDDSTQYECYQIAWGERMWIV